MIAGAPVGNLRERRGVAAMPSSVWIVLPALLSTATLLCAATASKPPCDSAFPRYGAEWLNLGGGSGLTNRRWAESETRISTSTVKNLTKKWEFSADGDVTTTPSISADGVVYFPDWSGSLFAVTARSGALLWKKNLTLLTAPVFGGNKRVISRTTPVIAGQRLIVAIYRPGAILALDRATGALLWSTILDSNPYAVVTMSGTAYNGSFYVGTSSIEEFASSDVCCRFQGALYKVRLQTGQVLWKVPMIPANGGRSDGYAGAGVWGSSPPIDVRRGEVYVATGNNYRVPLEVEECEAAYRNLTDPPVPDPCLAADNHAESVLAIRIDSGAVSWAKRLGGYDTWILTCTSPNASSPANCPAIPGPDYDFGMAPMLLTVPPAGGTGGFPGGRSGRYEGGGGGGRDVLVLGQKSGLIWALDRDSGDVVWETAVGPGGVAGGTSWGLATDGKRVFATLINSGRLNFTLLPGSEVVRSSGFVALNGSTGEVIWSKKHPTDGLSVSPPTHANGVVFFGSASRPSALFGLDAKTGEFLESVTSDGSAVGGPSVANGCAFFPAGPGPNTNSLAQLFNFTVVPGNSVVARCA